MKHTQEEEGVPHTDGGQEETHDAPRGTGQGYAWIYEGKCVVSFRMLTWYPEWSPVVPSSGIYTEARCGSVAFGAADSLHSKIVFPAFTKSLICV